MKQYIPLISIFLTSFLFAQELKESSIVYDDDLIEVMGVKTYKSGEPYFDRRAEIVVKSNLVYKKYSLRSNDRYFHSFSPFPIYDDKLDQLFIPLLLKNNTPFKIKIENFSATIQKKEKGINKIVREIKIDDIFSLDSFSLSTKDSSEFILGIDPIFLNKKEELFLTVKTDKGYYNFSLPYLYFSKGIIIPFSKVEKRYNDQYSKGKTEDIMLPK